MLFMVWLGFCRKIWNLNLKVSVIISQIILIKIRLIKLFENKFSWKVEWNQSSVLCNFAKVIKWTQMQVMGIQRAKSVCESQKQIIGIQWAEEVEKSQIQTIGIQWAKSVCESQKQWIGIEWAKEIGEYQKQFLGIEWTDRFLLKQDQFWGIQWTKEKWIGIQYQTLGIQIRTKIL